MMAAATALFNRLPARNRRGTAAVEFVLVVPVMLILLFALVDIGVAAMQVISCYEALRGVAAYAIYHPPADVTAPGSWLSAELPTGAQVSVLCNGATCDSTNMTATPKSFQLSQSVRINAVLLTSLAGTYTITYANRFQ